ncbi:DUF7344 domain-containing protein [Natronorubrum aibiense]|uniref:DUF7344 domain-containing protein n=1 Tax=Natronorubrum aibiense TaxID=348826 RepID=A0A5P9P6I0_9EURY|nr:hypothetical protein [Natronorubrum aibiense]QFU83769.1 hypothetical protein GCU68_15110 [Natronorubrum aibiense]
MSNSGNGRLPHARDELFDVLADETRRGIIRIVSERSPAGITKVDLATELAARTTDRTPAAVRDEDRQRLLVDCHHRTLPALFEAGLLEETDDGRLVATDHWAFDDADLVAAIDGSTDDAETDLDALFEALSDTRRRTLLSVLADQHEPYSTDALARAVAASETGTTPRDVAQERLERVHSMLKHVHLPVLNDAGIIGYDAESGLVSYDDHPALCERWLADTRDRRSDATRGKALKAATAVLRSASSR